MDFLSANTTNHRRIIMFVAAGVLGVFFVLVFYQAPPTIRLPIESGIVGLLVFEVMFRTRKWLNPKTLIVYAVLVTLINQYLYGLLYGDIFAQGLLSALSTFPSNLFFLLESFMVTGLAYYLIKGYRIESWSIPEPESIPADATGWRVFLARYQPQIMGFVGWYLVSWALVRPLGLNLFFLNIIALIVLALIKATRRVAGGILVALALNFTISLILGLGLNALCFIPFFTPISSPF